VFIVIWLGYYISIHFTLTHNKRDYLHIIQNEDYYRNKP